MFSDLSLEATVVEQCSSLVLKISRCVLLTQKVTKFRDEDVCPELSISLKEQENGGVCQCSEIEVNYKTPEPSTLDIRALLKTFSEMKQLITLLQMRANGACMSVAHAVESVIRVYNMYLSEESDDWRLSWRETEKEPGAEETFFLAVTIEVNVSGDLEALRVPLHSFLRKSQVLHPYLALSLHAAAHAFHRDGVPGLQCSKNWKDNFSHYLRLTEPRGHQVNVGERRKVLEGPASQPQHLALVYARVPCSRVGLKKHVHILLFDEDGFPCGTPPDGAWDAVQPTLPSDMLLPREAGACPALTDLCYSLEVVDAPAECYVMALVLGGGTAGSGSAAGALLQRHGLAVGYALREALLSMVKAGKQEEEDKQWCQQVAACIGDFLRFSLNEQFRENCLGMLEATNANDFEEKLEARLWGWCVDPMNPALPPRSGHKRLRNGQVGVSTDSLPCPHGPSSSAATPSAVLPTAPCPCSSQTAPAATTVDDDDEDDSEDDRKKAKIFEEWDSRREKPRERLQPLRSL